MYVDFLLSLAGIGFAFVLGCCAITGMQALHRRRRIRARINPLADLLGTTEELEAVPAPDDEGAGERPHPVVERLNAYYPLTGGVGNTLVALATGLLAFVALVLAFDFLGMSGFILFVPAALLAAGVGWNVGAQRESNRRHQFNRRFLVALEDFHRMVRHGISSAQALGSVAAVSEEPVATSLRNIVLETDFGVPVEAAMDREGQRVGVSELSMLAAVLATQSRTGGTLSEAVANLAAMLRERLDNQARMRAATAEARITLIVLSLIPLAAIGIQAAVHPTMVDVLLGEARHLLGIGAALILGGLVISWMMIRRAQH